VVREAFQTYLQYVIEGKVSTTALVPARSKRLKSDPPSSEALSGDAANAADEAPSAWRACRASPATLLQPCVCLVVLR
jgi:hypothetical protein